MSGGYLARGVIVQRVYVRGVFVLEPIILCVMLSKFFCYVGWISGKSEGTLYLIRYKQQINYYRVVPTQ